jgi:outer membrane lipoprotein-sorting protein
VKYKIHTNQTGIAHLMLILVVVVLLGVGGAGYYVWNKNKDEKSGSNPSQTASSKVVEDECKKAIDDKDFCKFASSVNFNQDYKTVITSTSAEGNSVMTLQSDSDGNTSANTTVNGEEVAAYVMLDDTSYTKDLTDGSWFKFTNETSEDINVSDDLDLDFEEDTSTPEVDKTEYKKIGKEACGNDTCFKYQIIDPEAPTDEQFVWFDDKDYQLRRFSFKNSEGTSDMTYSYENVTITAPSPTKEMPSAEGMSQAELEALMQQYTAE